MGLLEKAMTTATDVGKRALAGESLAFQHYRASGEGLVAFAGVLPRQMKAIELDGSKGWMAEKDAFGVRRELGGLRHRLPGVEGGPARRRGASSWRDHRTGTLVIAGQLHRVQPVQVRRQSPS